MPSDSTQPPSELVSGKYRLVRLLGRGGMGTVWEGVHEILGAKVAVKFIDSEFASSHEARQRFINEAKAAARLRSKHVVQIYDQGVAGDGRPYIVMEWLGGEPLDVRLDRQPVLPATEAATIVGHVCRALAKAHASGVVHRDLKPENVFLVHDDEDDTVIAKVVDFGIAKFVDASVPGSSSTQTGAVLGTPQYMSPEQARGLRSVDHRTDLWSVGVIAYRCLVGVLPFKGEAMGDLLVNICTSEPPVPSSVRPDVPHGFDAWIRRALSREPGDRFQSAAELADSLAALAGIELRLGVAAPNGPGATVVNPDVAAHVARAVAADGFGATTPMSLESSGSSEPRGAITAQPFATTPPPASIGGGRRFAMWIAGLVVLIVASALVARSYFMVGGEKADGNVERRGAHAATRAEEAARVAEPETRAAEVTSLKGGTVSSGVNAAPSAAAAEQSALAGTPAKGRRGHPRGTPKGSAAASVSKPATPVPRPARPHDELGY
jgi:serine/threonine-protein kinase